MKVEQVVAGALIDFAAFLTGRKETVKIGASHESTVVVGLLREWASERGLNLNEAEVRGWQEEL